MVAPIQKQFTEKTATGSPLRHITLVGGEYEADGKVLCENDKSTLRAFVDEMNRLKVPLSADIAAAIDKRHDLSLESYRIVNINGAHGGVGQDFAAFRDRAEIVIFCNIPLGNEARPGPDDKDLPAWRESLARSGASIAWINGSDSFPPESVMGDAYLTIAPDTDRYSYLIAKSYFESISNRLAYVDSPMLGMVEPYQNAGATSFRAAAKRGLQTPEDWNKYIISPRPALTF